MLALSGCAHTSSEPGVTHYLGWVRVEQPRTVGPDELHVREATSIGLRVGNGIGIGYEHEARVYVPLDCRLVVLVRSGLQLDRAVSQLNASGIKGGSMRCASFTLGRAPLCALGAAAMLLLGGCATPEHSNTLIFGTTTKFALDVSQDPTGAAGVTLGYRRQEAV